MERSAIRDHSDTAPDFAALHPGYACPPLPAPLCALICLARKSKLAAPHAAKQHDGQITQNLSRPLAKNISLSLSGKSVV
jgi:hypothetical protein